VQLVQVVISILVSWKHICHWKTMAYHTKHDQNCWWHLHQRNQQQPSLFYRKPNVHVVQKVNGLSHSSNWAL